MLIIEVTITQTTAFKFLSMPIGSWQLIKKLLMVTGGVFLIEFFLVKRFARTNISKLVDGVPNNVHASFFVNSTGIRLSVLFPKLLYLVGDLIRQVHASLVLRFKSLFDVVLHFVSDYLLAAR